MSKPTSDNSCKSRYDAYKPSLATLSLYMVAAFIIVLSPVYAQSFSVNIEPVTDEIFPDETAAFIIEVENFQNFTDSYLLSTDDFDWTLIPLEPLNNVASQDSKQVLVELSPRDTRTSTTRIVPIRISSTNNNEYQIVNAAIFVRSRNASTLQYTPSIFLSARIADQIDPREQFILSVYLRNRNARNYDDLRVLVQSSIVTKEYVTTLGPVTGEEGEKTNQVPLEINPVQAPGTYPLTVTIFVDNVSVNTFQTNAIVVSYDESERDENKDSNWFKYTTTYSVTNKGNTARTFSVSHPSSAFKRLFTDAEQSFTVDKENKAIVFSTRLEPQQEVSFSVVENFRLLAMLALLVVLCIIGYFVFRSPVVVSKEATIKGSGNDGVSEVKIRVHVKNRSTTPVNKIHVIDKLTSMADVTKENALGTLHPSKVVKKSGHGTLIRWDVDSLDSFEERIITYTAKTKLKLIGDVYLPAAKVKFEQRGRDRTVYSNEVNIDRD